MDPIQFLPSAHNVLSSENKFSNRTARQQRPGLGLVDEYECCSGSGDSDNRAATVIVAVGRHWQRVSSWTIFVDMKQNEVDEIDAKRILLHVGITLVSQGEIRE